MSKNEQLAIPTPAVPALPPNPTEMDLLGLALSNNSAIDVIERIAALREKAVARDAETQFNEAMTQVQSELGTVAPDLTNPQTHSKYASYAAIDKKIRPVYTRHGFSLSFDSGDSPSPDTVRVVCYVSHRAGHTRKYTGPPMPADGKGARGGDVMSKTHATGAAMSYGARYLLKYIFNIAVGEEDTDGNDSSLPVPEDEMVRALDAIANCNDMQELMKVYKAAYKVASDNNDNETMKAYIAAKDRRKKELQQCPS